MITMRAAFITGLIISFMMSESSFSLFSKCQAHYCSESDFNVNSAGNKLVTSYNTNLSSGCVLSLPFAVHNS